METEYVLGWYDSSFEIHGQGFKILQKVKAIEDSDWTYMYDDMKFMPPVYEWKLDELPLKWYNLTDKIEDTGFRRLWNKLRGKPVSYTFENRPVEGSVVICDYNGHYEVAEYFSHKWVTDMYYNGKIIRFAYIPKALKETTTDARDNGDNNRNE